MTTLNKKHCLIFIIVFFIFAKKINAEVLINEVGISPSESRFIELYNSGGKDVDLTGWYVQRKTLTGSDFSSLVSKTHFDGKSIKSGSYFIISKNSLANSDIIYDSLTITDSNTIQLKNSNQEIIDIVSWGDVLNCNTVCSQNPNEGNSLSRTSGKNWIITSATPGLVNLSNENNNLNDNIDNSVNNSSNNTITVNTASSSSSGGNIAIKKEIENPKIVTKIITKNIEVAGIPFEIDHQTIGFKKEKLIIGKFVWNFGDGMTKIVASSDPFQYVYQYPGDYVLSLSYYDSVLDLKPDSIDRLSIKVIPSGIKIVSIGTFEDPYIEIENNSNYEIILNKWIVRGSLRSFVIPEGMVILPNKKLKLSPRITGFDINDLSSITIINETGEIFATYPNKISIPKKYTDQKDSYKVLSETEVSKNIDTSKDVINLNNLPVSAAGSNFSDNYSLFGLFGIILVGIAGVLIFRNKKQYSEYVEKDIKASDMTIIE